MIKNPISRRAFLGGAGAMLALPFLPSIWPQQAIAAAANRRRLLVFYVPNGVNMHDWTPTGTGRDFELSPIMAPMAPYKEDLLVLSGLSNLPAIPEGPGGHAAGTGGLLTCAHVNKSEGSDIRAGISMDQLLVQERNPATMFPSLQLGTDGGADVGNCDSGYSCAYVRNISWAGPTTPIQKLVDPQIVFDRMFAGNDPLASREEKDKRRRYNKSILDYVLADANGLVPKLGTTDKRKLDEYMTGVRELETRITRPPAIECGSVEAPTDDLGFQDQVRSMCDLMVTAFQCDMTRVITFMLGNGISNRSFSFLGVTGGHHEISHHQDRPERLEALTTIGKWEMEQFAYLVGRLKEVEENDGSALDNSCLMFMSEMGDGDSHDQHEHPVLIAGNCSGTIHTGRHVQLEPATPLANLHMGVLDRLGVQVDTFGDDGTLSLAELEEA